MKVRCLLLRQSTYGWWLLRLGNKDTETCPLNFPAECLNFHCDISVLNFLANLKQRLWRDICPNDLIIDLDQEIIVLSNRNEMIQRIEVTVTSNGSESPWMSVPGKMLAQFYDSIKVIKTCIILLHCVSEGRLISSISCPRRCTFLHPFTFYAEAGG